MNTPTSRRRPGSPPVPNDAAATVRPRGTKAVWLVVKWSLTLLVVAFVAVRAVTLWRDGGTGAVSLRWGWLILAGVIYTLGWLPSVWYFRALLKRMGDDVSWPAVIRAYYVGHLGKYVPGKALVPLIRGHMVAAAGGRFRSSTLAVIYETLVMMGVGLEISVAFFPFLIPEQAADHSPLIQQVLAIPFIRWLGEHPVVLPLLVLAMVLVSLPVVAGLFSWVARRLAPSEDQDDTPPRIDPGLIGVGVVVFLAAWLIHGLALWATLRGIGIEAPLSRWPTWTVCVATSMTAGFLAIFTPGGFGVREGALMEILKVQPGIDARGAIASAFLLRAVGFVAEVIVAVILYYGLTSWSRPPSDSSRGPLAE